MYYSDLVKKAALISFEAHKNDLDSAGYPYFMHPLYLASQFDDENRVCVALLHDVVEDHGDKFSFEYLKDQGYNDEIIEALKLLTHIKGTEYLDYIKKIKTNEIARDVKLADLSHNLDSRRNNGAIHPKTEKYKQAIQILTEDN